MQVGQSSVPSMGCYVPGYGEFLKSKLYSIIAGCTYEQDPVYSMIGAVEFAMKSTLCLRTVLQNLRFHLKKCFVSSLHDGEENVKTASCLLNRQDKRQSLPRRPCIYGEQVGSSYW